MYMAWSVRSGFTISLAQVRLPVNKFPPQLFYYIFLSHHHLANNEMALLTRRLRCFYCGQRSASKKSTSVREWRCEHCEAMNYLDEVRTDYMRFDMQYVNTEQQYRMERLQTPRIP